MKNLLKRQSYNSGKRPSQHSISEKSFLANHGGSIMHNVLEFESIDGVREPRMPDNIFSISNTRSTDYFLQRCKEEGYNPHPARMQMELASFFIEFLTEPGDMVLDPFAGSNTTGFCAERAKRKWISIEMEKEYGKQSILRFEDPVLDSKIKVC
jgi:site-specific DNA-methyltransferase (cytosine-N4-specific)